MASGGGTPEARKELGEEILEGMGKQTDSGVVSLEGFWATADVPFEEHQQIIDEARLEMKQAVARETDYWERISSACMMDDPPPAEQLATVKEEFHEYATHWVRQGKSLDLITDFAAHSKLRQERFERRQARKQARQQADAQRLARLLTVPSHHLGGGGGGGRSSGPKQPVELFEPITVTMDFDPHAALAAISLIDASLEKVEGVCTNFPDVTKDQREILGAAYSHMMNKFKEPRLKRLYGYNSSDHRMRPLEFGQDVPSYYANVSDGSIYRRKLLSIAGLRNLIIYGPIIYHQLAGKHFVGDPNAYEGDVGLSLMRRVTGNVVDLDSTVLRCTDRATLNAINACNKHKKEKVYANSDDFSQSKQAQEIAINCSLPMMEDFAKMLKLTDAQQKKRHIHPSQISKPVPVAQNNTDRGKWPVWQYINCGQNSFHANVPTMDDVNGALLKAPFHCIQLWLLMHTIFDGAELDRRVDDFFENCVVDSCFNMKWKAIEEFAEKLSQEGTIVYVLQRVQAANQATFTMDFFENDNDNQDNEVAEMIKITKGLTGRDKKGKIRPIAEEEVAAWVRDPSLTF